MHQNRRKQPGRSRRSRSHGAPTSQAIERQEKEYQAFNGYPKVHCTHQMGCANLQIDTMLLMFWLNSLLWKYDLLL